MKQYNSFRFYVYAYLRSKDSNIAKAGTPYYIGKGQGKRAYSSNHGKTPVPKDKRFIVFLETNLSDCGSLAIERRFIRWYGKKIDNTGILINIHDGGDGSALHITTRIKLRELNLGKKQSQETIDKRMFGRKIPQK